jgi:hypothetical protein
VEQDRASPVLPHYAELAGSTLNAVELSRRPV